MNFLVQRAKADKKFLIFLLLFSFSVRILFFVVFLNNKRNYYGADWSNYHNVALQIAKGNGISDLDGKPSFWRVPGYSFFLAFFYKFFTTKVYKVLIIQLFLMSFIPLLVFLLSLVLFPQNNLLAKISSMFFTCNFGFLFYSGVMMSDLLFVFFLLLFLILFFWNSSHFLYKRIFFAGLFLGIASLIRPMGHYLLITSIFLLFVQNFSQNYIVKIKQTGVLLFGWLGIVAWWLLRNYVLSGGGIFFHTMPKHACVNYVATPIEMHINKTSFVQAHRRVREVINNEVLVWKIKLGRNLHEIEVCKIAEKVALDYFKKEPLFMAKIMLLNLVKTCVSLHSSFIYFLFYDVFPNEYETFTFWKRIKQNFFLNVQNKWMKFLVYFEIFILFFLILGFCGSLFLSFSDPNLLSQLLKCLPFIFLFLVLTIFSGFARLRLPIEPFWVIFSFYFWIRFFKLGK